MNDLKGLINEIARRGVEAGLLPAALTGMKFNRSISLCEAAVAVGSQIEYHGAIQEFTTDCFDPASGAFRHKYKGDPTYSVVLRDCFIACAPDQWGNLHYALFDSRGRHLREEGFGYLREHGLYFRRHARTAPRIKRATWPFRRWPKNHCHWILEDFPSILMAKSMGLASETIIPAMGHRTSFNTYCLDVLGLRSNPSADIIDAIVRFDELRLIRAARYNARSIQASRRALLFDYPQSATKRVYMSREAAQYRRIVNENAVWAELEGRGFQKVVMERLAPSEQIKLMSECEVVVGAHGAGLANIVFCPPNTQLIEFLDSSWLTDNHNIFRKCAGLGFVKYCAIQAQPTSFVPAPGYRDLVVDLDVLISALDGIHSLA